MEEKLIKICELNKDFDMYSNNEEIDLIYKYTLTRVIKITAHSISTAIAILTNVLFLFFIKKLRKAFF